MTSTEQTERRIERMARKAARVIMELESEGQLDAARRLKFAAIETANAMRAGRL